METEAPQPVTSLDSFLESLDDGHQTVEEGSFSVAVDKALHKLESHSLADPGLYVVELLAFAVAQGAEFYNISSEGDRCVAAFDGARPTETQLRNPLKPLFEGGNSPLLHLALALVGAKQLCPQDGGVRFDTGQGRVLTLRDREWVLEDGDPDGGNCTFSVNRPFRLIGERLQRRPSLKEVMEICRGAPLKLTVNGNWASGSAYSPFLGRETAGRLTLLGEKTLRIYTTESGLDLEEKTEHEFSASLYFGDVEKARKHGLVVVRNGVNYRTSAEDLGPGVCGVVATSTVRRDLSGRGVVRDAALKKIIDILNKEKLKFLEQLVQSEVRHRTATVKLRPLIERAPSTEVLRNWLKDQDSNAEPSVVSERIAEAYQRKRWDEVNELALIELARFLKEGEKLSYRPEKFFELAAAQSWIDYVGETEGRLSKAKEMLAACRFIQDKPFADMAQSGGLIESLISRAGGQDQITQPETRELVEAMLREQKLEEVCTDCARHLNVKEPEELMPYSYGLSRYLYEYWSYALELKGEKEKAAQVYRKLLNSSYCSLTNQRRQEVWFRLVRGRLSFAEWVRARVAVSGTGAWLFLAKYSERPNKGIETVLGGKALVPIDEIIQAFSRYFDETGKIFDHIFEFCYMSAGQSLRLQRRFEDADRLVAYCRLLQEVMEIRDDLFRN